MFVLTYTGMRYLNGEYVPHVYVIGIYDDVEQAKKAADIEGGWGRSNSDPRCLITFRHTITEIEPNVTDFKNFDNWYRIYNE